MGLFDNIYVEYPLPDPEVQFEVFQTKSLGPAMDDYTIDTNGRLIHHTKFYESVPEEERPFYGTPDWEQPIFKMFGCVRSINYGDRFMYDFSGEVRFYTSIGNYWYEYIAWFRDGLLKDLVSKHHRMENRDDS